MSKSSTIPRYLRVPEVAEMLCQTVRQVYADIEAGRLRAVTKRGQSKPYYVSVDELRRFMADEYEEVR